jgi:hypothetical protein
VYGSRGESYGSIVRPEDSEEKPKKSQREQNVKDAPGAGGDEEAEQDETDLPEVLVPGGVIARSVFSPARWKALLPQLGSLGMIGIF